VNMHNQRDRRGKNSFKSGDSQNAVEVVCLREPKKDRDRDEYG